MVTGHYTSSRRRHRTFVVALVGVAVFLIAVAVAATVLQRPAGRHGTAPLSGHSSGTTFAPPAYALLSNAQRAGRLVCMGVNSVALAVTVARDYHVGCFLLMPGGDVYASDATRSIASAAGYAPFFAVDEEGGTVARLNRDAYRDDTAAAMGGMADDTVEELGYRMGGEIRAIGANIDFAPVLDVDQPENAAIGANGRAFSDDPTVVADKAGSFARGLIRARVVPTFKHFPGLGRADGPTGGDSDTGTAITPDYDSLRTIDLKPYARLLPAYRRSAVMVGNQVVPGLSGGLPASLSPATYDALRSTYDFGGVAFTDSLSAASITMDPTAAVTDALRAGADLPLVTVASADQASAVVGAIMAAMDDGTLSETRVDAALGRIEKLRSELP